MPRQATANRSPAAGGSKAARKYESLIEKIIRNRKLSFAIAVLPADAVLVSLIISYVPYTKIDWDAYMSQVTGFLGGERDYSKLEGDTGPLVYPAGFLYIYSAIQYVTGGEVYPAQILFGVLYILNLGMVLLIYLKMDVVPWWALCLVSLSKRMHSIFVLRLFNDCFATTLFHAAMVSFLYQKWHLGLIIFSGAVSVKMNVLLYAPPLLLLLLKALDIFGVISAGAGAAVVQILLALPFIISYPAEYISRAFNLGRVFIHFWSVNFKFVPEQLFVSKGFALFLLSAHLMLLAVFAHYRWCRHEGGLFPLLHSKLAQMKLRFFNPSSPPLGKLNRHKSDSRVLRAEHIATTMFVGNFIGVVCARSLHYQFYSWYFYSLPYLLWRTPFLPGYGIFLDHETQSFYKIVPVIIHKSVSCSLILFVAVEFCWNFFPSNAYSSMLLLGAHLIILGDLWMAPPEFPYANENDTNDKPASLKKKAR